MGQSMRIWLNGEELRVAQQATVAHLVEAQPGVAVAVNGRIVRRQEWVTRVLEEGDRVEVVHAVQGG